MPQSHANWSSDVTARLVELPGDGDAQTAATISLMREFARADATLPPVRSLAQQIPASSRAAVDAVFWMVRRTVEFTRDSELVQGVEGWSPDTIEVLIRPVDLLTMHPPQGDCDDFSMLVASLLLAAGIPCSFATVAADPLEPTRYSHVYVVAHIPGGDVALDASHGSRPGWECANEFGKRRLWSVGSMNRLAGLGQTVPTFSTTVTAAAPTVPWWQLITSQALDIVKGRYGTPENTYVRQPDGTLVIRGSGTMTPTGVPTDVRADVRTDTTLRQEGTLLEGSTVWIIGGFVLLLVLVLMMRSNGGRR